MYNYLISKVINKTGTLYNIDKHVIQLFAVLYLYQASIYVFKVKKHIPTYACTDLEIEPRQADQAAVNLDILPMIVYA